MGPNIRKFFKKRPREETVTKVTYKKPSKDRPEDEVRLLTDEDVDKYRHS